MRASPYLSIKVGDTITISASERLLRKRVIRVTDMLIVTEDDAVYDRYDGTQRNAPHCWKIVMDRTMQPTA